MDVISYLTGITHAVSAYKTAVQTLDEAKITAATHELTVQLTHFGAEVLSMQKDGVQATQRERELLSEISDLKDKVREFERLRAERERYELVEPYPGTYVYRVKAECRDSQEPMHYVCPGCLDNRKIISRLQGRANPDYVSCFECEKVHQIREDGPI